jgi:hypothetical protein
MGISFALAKAIINCNRCNIVALPGYREACHPLPRVFPRLNYFSASSVAGRVNIRHADEVCCRHNCTRSCFIAICRPSQGIARELHISSGYDLDPARKSPHSSRSIESDLDPKR